MSPLAFDERPLVDKVDARAVREFARSMRSKSGVPGGNALGFVIAAVVLLVVLVFIIVSGINLVGAVLAGRLVLSGGAALPFGVVSVILAFVAFFVLLHFRTRNERWWRLDRFARANGMTFVPRVDAPALPGMIFGQGSDRFSSDVIRSAQPRFVEFANYRYTTGSGKNRTTHRWGYVAVKLDVPLPHIILDATGNNGLFGSNLPAAYDRDQRLGLEGDFDKHFSLYCPAGYERDALYLFTPDVMARFIDNVAELDVEIIDDWLFLYAKRDMSTLDPATWGWLFSVVVALIDKLAQWGRWRDDRLAAARPAPALGAVTSGIPGAGTPLPPLTPPPAGVAEGGRRLKSGVPWFTIVAFGAFALFWAYSVFSGIVSDLTR